MVASQGLGLTMLGGVTLRSIAAESDVPDCLVTSYGRFFREKKVIRDAAKRVPTF